jgi:hypothetical protein
MHNDETAVGQKENIPYLHKESKTDRTQEITLYSGARGSNPTKDTGVFLSFFSPFRQLPEEYLALGHDTSLPYVPAMTGRCITIDSAVK